MFAPGIVVDLGGLVSRFVVFARTGCCFRVWSLNLL